jgi:hypothetical protein
VLAAPRRRYARRNVAEARACEGRRCPQETLGFGANATRGEAICTNSFAEQKLIIALAHTVRSTMDQYLPEFERALRAEWAVAAARMAGRNGSRKQDGEFAFLRRWSRRPLCLSPQP